MLIRSRNEYKKRLTFVPQFAVGDKQTNKQTTSWSGRTFFMSQSHELQSKRFLLRAKKLVKVAFYVFIVIIRLGFLRLYVLGRNSIKYGGRTNNQQNWLILCTLSLSTELMRTKTKSNFFLSL